MMIDKGSEPYTTEEIENEIDPSEHPGDKYWACLEVCPEGDRKPEEHIRESCDCGIGEDVGKKFL